MPKKYSTTYWVASRCINNYESGCAFNVRMVHGGTVDASDVYNSYDSYIDSSLALRPVVSLSSDLLVQAKDGTWTVK